jgi:hypothetical protein
MVKREQIDRINKLLTPCLSGLEESLEQAATSFSSFDPKVSLIFSGFRERQAKDLQRIKDETLALLKAPLYVGFLGRYSHGKSSLINALLDLQEGLRLPVGETVTTSKVCVVEFDETLSEPEYIETELDLNRETSIGSGQFTQRVISPEGVNQSSSPSYMLRIPGNVANDISRVFQEASISLVDMPGLGGPYFNDSILTNLYIKDLDMVCIAINACKIHEAAVALNAPLEQSHAANLKKLIVATFWDETGTCAEYQNCSDELERQERFRELIRKEMKALAGSVSDTLFVDSVSDKKTGIANLRTQIRRQVEGTVILTIGTKANYQPSPVFVRKLKMCRAKLSELSTAMNSFTSDLKSKVESSMDNTPTTRELSSKLKTLKDNADRNMDRFLRLSLRKLISEYQYKYKHNLSEMRTVTKESELAEVKEKTERDVRENIVPGLRRDLQSSYEMIVANNLKHDIEKVISALPTENSDLSHRFDEQIQEGTENIFGTQDEYDLPIDLFVKIQEDVRAVVGTALKHITNPLVYLWALGGFIAIVISRVEIPLIMGQSLSLSFLAPLGIIAIAVAFFRIIPTYKKQKDKAFRESLKKRIVAFEKDFLDYLQKVMDSDRIHRDFDRLKTEIVRDLQKEFDPSIQLRKNVFQTLQVIRQDLVKTLDDLRAEEQKI